MVNARYFINLGRPQNALIPVVSFFIGYLFIYQSAESVRTLLFIGVSIFLLSMFATVQNDIEDYDIDKSNGRASGLHGSTPIKYWHALIYMYVLLLIACVLLLLINTASVWAVSFFTVLLVFAYNKAPLYLSRKPLSSIVVMTITAVTMPIILGLLLSTNNSIGMAGVFLASALSLQRLSIIILKDYKDVKGDAIHKKQTFLLQYGYVATKKVSIIVGLIGYVCLLISSILIFENRIFLLFFAMLYGFLSYQNLSLRLSLKESYSEHNSSIFLKVIKRNYQADLLILITLLLNIFI